jgi:hypothetical protein
VKLSGAPTATGILLNRQVVPSKTAFLAERRKFRAPENISGLGRKIRAPENVSRLGHIIRQDLLRKSMYRGLVIHLLWRTNMRDEIAIPIGDEARTKLEAAGKIKLKEEQLAVLKEELANYALHRESELAVGPSVYKRKRRVIIAKDVTKLIAHFRDLQLKISSANEHFDEEIALNDEILFGFADVEEKRFLQDLFKLKAQLEEPARAGRPSYLWLGGLLESLASLYVQSGGRRSAVSKKAAKGKSTFLNFAWIAMQLLPTDCRPHSFRTLVDAWEKQRKD